MEELHVYLVKWDVSKNKTGPISKKLLLFESYFLGSLACTFCHTGTQKLLRNLKAGEILGQLMNTMSYLEEFGFAVNAQRKLSHIVFMGQGEPLYNFKEVSIAVKIATSEDGLAFPRSKITLSTSGIVPLIEKVGSELGIQLAISLHAATDEAR
jgi:23S rRNA (adenine2503-C2)-methyltransferase